MSCRVCGWTGNAEELKGLPPFSSGCPECWRFGKYIPATVVEVKP